MSKIHIIDEAHPLTEEYYNDICADLLSIDPNSSAISNGILNIAAQYSYYHGIMIKSKRLLDKAVEAFDQYKAGARNEKRKESVKLTAAAAEDYVYSLPSSAELVTIILHRQETYGYAKGICSSIEMKKDMLVQLSANSRMETKLYSSIST